VTDRSYRVRLEANVVGFIAQVGVQAVGAVNKLEHAAQTAGRQIDKIGDSARAAASKIDLTEGITKLDKLATSADKNSQALNTIGSGAQKVGLVAAAGLGAAAKAAIDWESAWAGVTKTVNGSNAEMAELEGQLRGMAKTLPATHQEIAAVAEAAGQLGVHREDIAGFTRVMIDLGETTNLTADEAATSLAQFMNVMQTAPKDVGRLGAAIVALGNNGASTERDIVAMAQRIAGSGRIIGLTETQVLGFASALANVGIEAEAGGSAISTIFTKIDKAVSEGGDSLENFARVSGMTAAQFKQQFERDAAGATLAFIQGIGQINEAGQDVNGTLETLGITEIRQRDAVLRLAASGTNLADSLKVSADGWRENTALVQEAEKRYATTESQIRIAWNNIKDSAITAGSEMLPVIADIADKVAAVASAFGELPGPVKTGGVALLGIIAAGGLIGGSMAKLVTSVASARTAMIELGATSARTATALSAFTKAGIVGASIVGLLALTDALDQAFGNVPKGNLSQLSLDLETLGKTSQASGALAERFGEALDGVTRRGPDLKGLGATFKAALGADIPQIDGNAKSVKAIDEALASLVQGGNVDGAAAAFNVIAAEAAKAGLSIEDVQSLLPKYVSNLGTAQAAAKAAGDGAGGASGPTKSLGQALSGTGDAAKDAADQLKAYIDALFKVPGLVLSVRDAQRGVQSAMDDATASIKENGRTLDISNEKGRANQEALDAIAESANKLSEAYLNSNASQKQMTDAAVAARASFVKTAVSMGMPKAAAKALAEQLIAIPTKVDTTVTNNAGADKKPSKDAQSYADILRGTLPKVTTFVSNNAGAAPLTAAQRYDQQLRGTLQQVKTFVTNNAPVAQSKIAQYNEVLGLVPQGKSTKVSTPGATVSQGQVGGLLELLSSLPSSKSVTINTYRNMIETTTHRDIGVRVNEDGGYYPVNSYANGKLPNQAMIMPPKGRHGLVQWAEQKTGGEAFIPLAESKRARSTAILAQVAGEFGMQLAPAAIDPGRYNRAPASSTNGGGPAVVKEIHIHQNNTFNGVSMDEADLIASRANAKAELAARGV
jgi:TP901 family phage tail tape measure protein